MPYSMSFTACCHKEVMTTPTPQRRPARRLGFSASRTTATARRLFLFSLVYLAVLWAALVADRLWG